MAAVSCASTSLRKPRTNGDTDGDSPPLALRRVPAPQCEPPFDDSSASEEFPVGAVQGTLALSFDLPSGVPAVPQLPETFTRQLRLVPALPTAPGTGRRPATRASASHDLEEFGPRQTPRTLLCEPKPWAGRLVQAIVEVVSGVRPAAQLLRWTTTEVYDAIRSHGLAKQAANSQAGRRRAAVVRSVHVSEPDDGVAEVCAVVHEGARCRAIALRLEGLDGRWQCTALQFG